MRTAALFALSMALSGCSVLPERPPSPAVHDFGPSSRSPSPVHGAETSVSVSAPEWLLDDQIHYRLAFDDPTRVRYYSLDRWVAPPPSLLTQRLASGISGPYQLHIRLLDFEQIFDGPAASRVVMRFRATLKTDGNTRAEQEFRLGRPCPSADAKGAVTGFAALVGDAVGALQAWVTGQSGRPTEGSSTRATP